MLTPLFRLDRAEWASFARLNSPGYRMAHTVHVQGHHSHAADLDQMSRSKASSHRRLLFAHARAAEANGMVVNLQQLVQEREEAWPRHGHLAWYQAALLRIAEGTSIRGLRY